MWPTGSAGVSPAVVAVQQLLQYREALEKPPLLVVCDTDRIIVHTNFINTVKQGHGTPRGTAGQQRVPFVASRARRGGIRNSGDEIPVRMLWRVSQRLGLSGRPPNYN